MTRVTCTPRGRTNVAIQRAVGQALYVLSGVGRYQMDGGPVEEICPGDTVIIPPNTRHWHGAAPDQMMCHLALSESDDQGNATDWLLNRSARVTTRRHPADPNGSSRMG